MTGETLGAFGRRDLGSDRKGGILAIGAAFWAGITDTFDTVGNKGRACADTQGSGFHSDTLIVEEEEPVGARDAVGCRGSIASAAGGVAVGTSGTREELASFTLWRSIENASLTIGAVDGKPSLALRASS